jgi:hypothetical protein
MKTVCVLVVVVIAFPVLTLAQNSRPTPRSVELQRKREAAPGQDDLRRAEAISLVQNTAAEAPLWDDKKTAVGVLADAADLLWDESPGQGTKWLSKAWDLIDQVPESPKNEKLRAFFTRSDQTSLRTTVLSVARRHDSELAEKFLRQLSQNEPTEKKERGAFDNRTARSEQLLTLAQQAVDSNPDLAFTLAERSFADGLSYGLQNVLTNLRTKNVELANRLFDLALARFSGTPSDPSEAEVLAGYLFKSGFTFSANSAGQTILVVNPAHQNLPAVASSEPQRAKNFLIAVYEVLLSRPVALDSAEGTQGAQQILALGGRMAGQYNTFAPELVPAVQGFLAQLRRQLSLNGEASQFTEASRSASTSNTTKSLADEEIYEKHLSELEERADKENNPIAKKLAYLEAAVVTNPKDYQRAKRIAEKIDDDELRADAVSFVLYRAVLFLVEKAEIEKAVEIVPAISDVSRRAVVKIAIAQRLLSSKSERAEPSEVNFVQQRAVELLTDIDSEIKKRELSANGAKIMLGRTAVLAKLDKAQALTSLEQTVQMINKLDRFDLRDSAAPNLGLSGFSASGATLAAPRVGFDFRSAIEALLLTNFTDVAAAAETLRIKETRGVARLEIARLFLKQNRRTNNEAQLTLGHPRN